jgi:hypothetical protein
MMLARHGGRSKCSLGSLQHDTGSGNAVAGDLEAVVCWAWEVVIDPCAKRLTNRLRKRQALRRTRYLKTAAELPGGCGMEEAAVAGGGM